MNKKYDDQGHLMRYDSTYTWSYSSGGGGQQDADSLMQLLEREEREAFMPFAGMGRDSLLQDNFFPGYMMGQWGAGMPDMTRMIAEMDSLLRVFTREDPLPAKRSRQRP